MIKLILTFLLTFLWIQPIFAQYSRSPDVFNTETGDLTIHPINHGSVVFTFDGITIFVDPYGGPGRFAQFSPPDIIFITDIHSDHLHPQTLNGLETGNTIFVAPEAAANELKELKDLGKLIIMDNGKTADVMNLSVTAIPMYNLPGDESARHPKGRGNGYIIDFGGTNVYISGDTEDISEMRALDDIDIAFVCMNLPYTMDVSQAASAVIEFQPSVVYPYHHRGQDIEEFKSLVDNASVNVEVRLKNWYTN